MKRCIAIAACSMTLWLVSCSADFPDPPTDEDPGSATTTSPPSSTQQPAEDTPATPPAEDTPPPAEDTPPPAEDTPTQPATPPVPSDPTICKDCSAEGNDGCPANGSYTYMCVQAWYQPPSGSKVEESYCARRCETTPCPDSFVCLTMPDPPAQVCIPQPHNVCALLGQ